MDLAVLISAFVLISLTELGDKTMIAVITLSSKYPKRATFLGSYIGLAAVTAIGVLIGEVLFQHVPPWIVGLAAGAVFILFGVVTLLRKEEEGAEVRGNGRWGGLLTSFGFVALMELGDKTQLSVIALSAESGAALMVFLGAALGFLWLTVLEVALGKAIGEKVPKDYIRIGSGLLFIAFGIIFLVQQLL
ncbi:MAG TPA: TMEM165/GDT1 family protein [Methanomassiliicoccales archaeon]|jgi:putative Ca2+/H+ antiporter (TMEM165/GDT1 family)|nr:TMEM165/GDT1 family protein [Methanomassiliicoccales archaeon]